MNVMPRYRVMALLVAQIEVDADSPEEADILFRHMSLDMLEPVEVVNTQLLVAVPAKGKGKRAGDDIEWEIVSEWTQPDLWAARESERQHDPLA